MDPDAELAGRDNDLAAVISNLAHELADMYNRATRLLVKVTDPDGYREPDVYTLASDDGVRRTFVASPGLDGRNRVVYDRATRTIQWFGETYDDLGAAEYTGQLSLNLGDATVAVQGATPARADAEFYRQKTARLRLNTYKAVPLYFQTNPRVDMSVSGGATFQPGQLYLPANGAYAVFNPPITDGAAHYRLAVYFEPSRVIRAYGSLNRNGVPADNAITATLAGAGQFLNWRILFAAGQYTLRLNFSDYTAATPTFGIRVVWNSQVLFDGIVVYGQPAGTFAWSNTYVLASDGTQGSFTVERTDGGTGALSIGVVEFTNVAAGNLSCQLAATMGGQTSTANFSSESGRPDVLFFDFFSVAPGTIELDLNNVVVGGLYIKALDIRRYAAQRQTPNAARYRLWKRTFITLALEAVRTAYTRSNVGLAVFPTYASAGVWDSSSTTAWMGMLAAFDTRLLMAFRPGRPGDVGQPALTPGSLYYDIPRGVVRQGDVADNYPTMQVFQAWMISAGLYVFDEDFWVEEFQFSGPVTDCDFVTADFTAAAG
jgi:hypothetical protein